MWCRRADILPDGSAVLTLKPILSSDSNSNLLSRRPDLRMNLWATIYLYEEEKTEEVEEEDDDDHLQIKGIKNVNSNEFSFSNVYEDKEESKLICSVFFRLSIYQFYRGEWRLGR